MSTIIYPSPIFGPVRSRRLGLSLGINLMPADGKVCTFDCIYCECGLNAERRPTLPRPTRQQVADALEATLRRMEADGQTPDVLTFAGNGEPTCHPCFSGIIDDTISLRDRFCPQAKVSVLSNATQLHRPDVVEALMRVDNNIQKLDTVDMDFIRLIDRPTSARYSVETVIEQLRQFHGHVIIQTMFLRGEGQRVQGVKGVRGVQEVQDNTFVLDNTSDHYVLPWLEAVKSIQPQQVMIYTIDRETPVAGLAKATPEELNRIRDMVIAAGIACTASY